MLISLFFPILSSRIMQNMFYKFLSFRYRNDLQKAIEEEDYGGAAELRDQISKLEVSLL